MFAVNAIALQVWDWRDAKASALLLFTAKAVVLWFMYYDELTF
jgi:hypothetical protein